MKGLYGGLEPREVPAYPLADVARHLRIAPNTLRSWVRGRVYNTSGGQKQFSPIIKLPDENLPLLSFVNIVEIHVLQTMRRDHGIPFIKVRKAIDFLSERFNTAHPLADVDFFTHDLDLFVFIFEDFINASAYGQYALREIAVAVLDRIDRDQAGRAAQLYPFIIGRDLSQEPKAVIIDPAVCFGRALLAGTRIPTEVIYDRFKAGESIQTLSSDYNRPVSDIQYAIRYEQKESERNAA